MSCVGNYIYYTIAYSVISVYVICSEGIVMCSEGVVRV